MNSAKLRGPGDDKCCKQHERDEQNTVTQALAPAATSAKTWAPKPERCVKDDLPTQRARLTMLRALSADSGSGIEIDAS
jgi:hypothetical protein